MVSEEVEAVFDWLSLDDNESVVWQGKPHESSLVPALVVGIPLSLVLVGIPIIVTAYLQRENTAYVVTTDALYRKSGVLSRSVQRVDFGKVQNTTYSQGFFGQQFGYGTVDISTAGGAGVELAFESIPESKRVQGLIKSKENTCTFRRGMNPTLCSPTHRRHASRIFNARSSVLVLILT